MSDGTLGELVAELRAESLSIIGETSEDDPERSTLDKNIDTLASLLDQNVSLVFPALEDIHEALAAERDLNGDSSTTTRLRRLRRLSSAAGRRMMRRSRRGNERSAGAGGG